MTPPVIEFAQCVVCCDVGCIIDRKVSSCNMGGTCVCPDPNVDPTRIVWGTARGAIARHGRVPFIFLERNGNSVSRAKLASMRRSWINWPLSSKVMGGS